MKGSLHRILHILCTLGIISVLGVFSSCTDRDGRIAATLAQADSLLNIDPERSLEFVRSVDSLGRLSRRDMAYRDYLRTAARYKAFYPVDRDTAIFSATDYFRRRGPQELYGRSLMIQGAVLYEQGRTEEALETYIQAEPLLEEVGTYEDLGLINTRIGELYQTSFVNDSAARDRKKKALEYFKLTRDKRRIATSYIGCARSVASKSPAEAEESVRNGISVAAEIGDTSILIDGYEILIYLLNKKGDDRGAIDLSNYVLQELSLPDNQDFQRESMETICRFASDSYINIGEVDSAAWILARIHPDYLIPESAVFYCRLLSDIAKVKGDWKTAYEYSIISSRIYDSIMSSKYSLHLVDVEKRYENAKLESVLQARKAQYNRMIVLFVCAMMIAVTVFLTVNLQRKKRIIQYEEYLLQVEGFKRDTEKANEQLRSESRELHAVLGKLISLIDDIGYTYSTNESNPGVMAKKVQNKIDEYLTNNDIKEIVRHIVDDTYPGMLESIFSSSTKLTEVDKWLISFLCVGFDTNTICVMTRLSDSQLNYHKSRIAKKLNITVRISMYLRKQMETHQRFR